MIRNLEILVRKALEQDGEGGQTHKLGEDIDKVLRLLSAAEAKGAEQNE